MISGQFLNADFQMRGTQALSREKNSFFGISSDVTKSPKTKHWRFSYSKSNYTGQ